MTIHHSISQKKVTKYLKGLETPSSFQVPRCLQYSDEVSESTFHVFSDTSKMAYGSIIYQRSIYRSSKISTNLVMSKSKVAPIQENIAFPNWNY